MDSAKMVYTYTIALVVIAGGFFILFATRLDPPEADIQGLRLLMSGFIGLALQFVFSAENATRASRQAERTYAHAAEAAAATAASTVTTTTPTDTTTTTQPQGQAQADPTTRV